MCVYVFLFQWGRLLGWKTTVFIALIQHRRVSSTEESLYLFGFWFNASDENRIRSFVNDSHHAGERLAGAPALNVRLAIQKEPWKVAGTPKLNFSFLVC